jgi:hypothetical protein
VLQEFILTPRQLEHINIQRKLRGKPPLNSAGFDEAVAYAWGEPRLRPITLEDWVAYLMIYECFGAAHQANTVSCGMSLTIRPCPGHTL